MKKIWCIVLLISVIISISGCGTTNKSYILAYDILTEPQNLDPQTASDPSALTIINNIFEGLFYIDEFGILQNGLAKSVNKSDNGLIYTIQLKENVLWENGEKVTAHDFVFGMKRLFIPNTKSPAVSQFYSIKNGKEIHTGVMDPSSLGVKALSDDILQIELAYKNDNLTYLLATTYAMPCNEKFFNETKGKYGLQSQKIISNGAFTVYSWKRGETIKLRKNVHYYDSENVKPTGVNLHVTEKEITYERLLDESINAAFIDGIDINQFQHQGHNMERIENETWGLYLNTDNEWLSELNIRKAIASCFNRDMYTDKLSPNLSVATGIIPHSIMLYDETFRTHAGENITPEYDAQQAYKYYQAGLKNLNKKEIEPLELLVNKEATIDLVEYFSAPSQLLQKELSLYINIDEVDANEYNRRISVGEFDIAIYELSANDYSIGSIFSDFKSDSDNNYISYSSLEYDKLISDALSMPQKQAVIKNYKEAEQTLIDDAVFIPMIYATDFFVSTSKTSGIVYNKRTGLISFKSAVIK